MLSHITRDMPWEERTRCDRPMRSCSWHSMNAIPTPDMRCPARSFPAFAMRSRGTTHGRYPVWDVVRSLRISPRVHPHSDSTITYRRPAIRAIGFISKRPLETAFVASALLGTADHVVRRWLASYDVRVRTGVRRLSLLRLIRTACPMSGITPVDTRRSATLSPHG